MSKFILNLAVSLDGYISDLQGGFEWIQGQGDSSNDTLASFDFPKFLKSIDTIIMGSKAYEDNVLSGLESYKDKQLLVASTRVLEKRANVEFIQGDIGHQVLTLKNKPGKNIWLFGCAVLTEAFIKENLVDEYIIGIIPTLLGQGRSLFRSSYPKLIWS